MPTNNLKEKNIITVELTNNEKIVYSQLGINPLIKLGKEHILSNNVVRLKDNDNNQKETLLKSDPKSIKKVSSKKQSKKILKSQSNEAIEVMTEEEGNTDSKSPQITNDNYAVSSIEQDKEMEPSDDINNARKKRRRSSASIE